MEKVGTYFFETENINFWLINYWDMHFKQAFKILADISSYLKILI